MSYRLCLNTSTIREGISDLGQAIDICAAAGFQAIEPWLKEIEAWQAAGHSLAELRQRCDDAGLAIPNLIAFPQWCVDDEAQRRVALEEARRCFAIAAELGCGMVAVPPAGLVSTPGLDLLAAAARYRAVYDIGQEYGVIALLEFWGPAASLGRLGEALFILSEADRSEACLLVDIFHMAKKGTPFSALRHCGPDSIGLVHVNDPPAGISIADLKDADRVYPGQGCADWACIFAALDAVAYQGYLSLELFNPRYWQQDPLSVAQTGKAAIEALVQRFSSR